MGEPSRRVRGLVRELFEGLTVINEQAQKARVTAKVGELIDVNTTAGTTLGTACRYRARYYMREPLPHRCSRRLRSSDRPQR